MKTNEQETVDELIDLGSATTETRGSAITDPADFNHVGLRGLSGIVED